jgi:hypothetical protein
MNFFWRCSGGAGVPAAPGYSVGAAGAGYARLGMAGLLLLLLSMAGLLQLSILPQGQRWKVAGGLTPDAAGCLSA